MGRQGHSYVRPIHECVRCHRPQTTYGRGLCQNCHNICTEDGTLADYEKLNGWSRDDVLDFYMLSRTAMSQSAMAAAMGMKMESLQRALQRARKAGDKRAFTPAG